MTNSALLPGETGAAKVAPPSAIVAGQPTELRSRHPDPRNVSGIAISVHAGVGRSNRPRRYPGSFEMIPSTPSE